jgi:hypothetical protein
MFNQKIGLLENKTCRMCNELIAVPKTRLVRLHNMKSCVSIFFYNYQYFYRIEVCNRKLEMFLRK